MFEDKIFEQFLGRPRADRSGEIIPKVSSNDSGTERFYISSKKGDVELFRRDFTSRIAILI